MGGMGNKWQGIGNANYEPPPKPGAGGGGGGLAGIGLGAIGALSSAREAIASTMQTNGLNMRGL